MKKVSIISTVLLSLLAIDTIAYAAAARRSAVVVRGPAGGVAVGASRTAIGRPGYGFVSNFKAPEKAGNQATVVAKAAGEKACESNMKALRTSH